MSHEHRPPDQAKREFLQKSAYVVPAVLTLAAAPSFASAGSGRGKGKYKGDWKGKGGKGKD